MKNSVAIILCLMCYLQAFSLSPNTKMGKPTMEELQMNSYEPEPDANAVVLFRQTEVYFSYLATVGFRVVYNNKVRIKILKPEGTDYGDVVIPYCNPEGSTLRESIQDLKAASYNLENGKIVTSKLTNDLKHTERIDKKYCQQKFSIPNVKEGSVIEYQYSTHSDFFWQIDTWYAQQELPVFYTEYNIETPEWFTFHCEQSGYHTLVTKTRMTPIPSCLVRTHYPVRVISFP